MESLTGCSLLLVFIGALVVISTAVFMLLWTGVDFLASVTGRMAGLASHLPTT